MKKNKYIINIYDENFEYVIHLFRLAKRILLNDKRKRFFKILDKIDNILNFLICFCVGVLIGLIISTIIK